MSLKKSLPWVLLAFIACAVGGILLLQAPLGRISQEKLSQPRVYAYKDWQSIGVQVDPGDRLYLRARGEWLYTPGEYHGPEGHKHYRAPNTYPIPGAAGGLLVARIGEDGAIIPIGRGTSLYVDQPGTVYLRINDDILSDNEGYVSIEVEVRVPETPGVE
ncbi:MAG: hypothetical protein RBT47_12705 [Anaerolineae bacterium]|nr:hypothetical protein [Anaerolineae bacterium]